MSDACPPAVPAAGRRGRWRRLPLWAKATLGAAGVVLALVVAAVVFIAAMLGGGLDDLISLSTPTESDDRVVRAGDQAQVRLERDAAGLAAELAGVLGAQPLDVTGTSRSCRVGQHNFKIDDDYDLQCSASRLVLLHVPSGTDHAQVAQKVGLFAGRAGYDELYPGSALAVPEPGSGYVPRGLYGRGALELQVVLSETASQQRLYATDGMLVVTDGAGSRVDDEAVLQGLPAGGVVVGLTLQDRYFSE